jgi:hypothetical protein
MSKQTAKEHRRLENLVRSCKNFVGGKPGVKIYVPGWSRGYSPSNGIKYEVQGLIIKRMWISPFLGHNRETITVQKKGSRRIELRAWLDSYSASENIKVAIYRRGDWEKKIPKKARV